MLNPPMAPEQIRATGNVQQKSSFTSDAEFSIHEWHVYQCCHYRMIRRFWRLCAWENNSLVAVPCLNCPMLTPATSIRAFVRSCHNHSLNCSSLVSLLLLFTCVCLLLGGWLGVDWLCPVCRRECPPPTRPIPALLLSCQDFFGVRSLPVPDETINRPGNILPIHKRMLPTWQCFNARSYRLTKVCGHWTWLLG